MELLFGEKLCNHPDIEPPPSEPREHIPPSSPYNGSTLIQGEKHTLTEHFCGGGGYFCKIMFVILLRFGGYAVFLTCMIAWKGKSTH